MGSGIIIRRAVPLDCSNIARLLKASWSQSQAAFAAQVNDHRAVTLATEVIADGHVVVAELSGRLIGALACVPMRERWSRHDDWFLGEEFFVLQSPWETRGIAEKLLAEAEQFADEQNYPLLLGGSLMISFPLERLLSRRDDYSRVNAQWLRMPKAWVSDGSHSETMAATA